MTDYEAIRKEIMEKHSESLKVLYISELKDEIEHLREVLRINTEQQAEHIKILLESWEKERKILTDEIAKLRNQIAYREIEYSKLSERYAKLEKTASDASWTAEMYRNQIDDRPKW